MFSTVNTVIFYIKEALEESELEWSLFKYKTFAWMTVIFYASIMLTLYFFMAFGARKIAKREGMSKTWIAWIPFAQLIVLLKSSNAGKICWMKKKTFTLVVVILSVCSFVCSVVLNTIQYFNTTIKLLFLKNDGWNIADYVLRSENNYMYLVEIFTFASTFFLYFLMYDFFRQRTGKYWLMTVLCIFFSGLFPIFVFVYRNAPKADYARRYVYYTNVPPRGNNSPKQNAENSPFEDFNKVDPKDEPFSEFTTSSKNDNSSYNGSESSDDDMFN